MRSLGLLSGLLLAAAAHGSSLHIQSATPTDSAGTPITPSLGQPFWVTVHYAADTDVDGTMTVAAPWLHLTSPVFRSYAGNRQATYGPITPLFDGSFNMTVSVGDSSALALNVTPGKPAVAIEYFAPQTWYGSFQSTLVFAPGAAPKVTWAIPQPPTFGFQQAGLTRAAAGQAVATGVLQILNTNTVGLQFSARTSSVRVNSQKLTATFTDLKKLPSDVKPYLNAETLIESGDKTVKTFVANTLPKNFAKTTTVYEAARMLFQATVARLNYVNMNGARPSAVFALKYGYGDCGFFADLFVASARQAGIPARPITGFLEGSNEWHVWAEFYVPNAGWVPVDPSYADGLDPQGKYPLYFGVIPDLNSRVATAIGFDHSYAKNKVPMLQSPMAFTSSKVTSMTTTCDLSSNATP